MNDSDTESDPEINMHLPACASFPMPTFTNVEVVGSGRALVPAVLAEIPDLHTYIRALTPHLPTLPAYHYRVSRDADIATVPLESIFRRFRVLALDPQYDSHVTLTAEAVRDTESDFAWSMEKATSGDPHPNRGWSVLSGPIGSAARRRRIKAYTLKHQVRIPHNTLVAVRYVMDGDETRNRYAFALVRGNVTLRRAGSKNLERYVKIAWLELDQPATYAHLV